MFEHYIANHIYSNKQYENEQNLTVVSVNRTEKWEDWAITSLIHSYAVRAHRTRGCKKGFTDGQIKIYQYRHSSM